MSVFNSVIELAEKHKSVALSLYANGVGGAQEFKTQHGTFVYRTQSLVSSGELVINRIGKFQEMLDYFTELSDNGYAILTVYDIFQNGKKFNGTHENLFFAIKKDSILYQFYLTGSILSINEPNTNIIITQETVDLLSEQLEAKNNNEHTIIAYAVDTQLEYQLDSIKERLRRYGTRFNYSTYSKDMACLDFCNLRSNNKDMVTSMLETHLDEDIFKNTVRVNSNEVLIDVTNFTEVEFNVLSMIVCSLKLVTDSDNSYAIRLRFNPRNYKLDHVF